MQAFDSDADVGADVSSGAAMRRDADDGAAMRRAMVISQLRPNGVTDVALLEAMLEVPREEFVPAERRAATYIDRSIPLGQGRALNPPLTTALLIQAAAIGPDSRVLLVGEATDYAEAIIRRLTASIVVIDCATAMTAAPGSYDAIVIDGAAEVVPDALIAQLAASGRLAAGIVDHGVTRLAVGRRGGNSFALVPFVDGEAVVLTAFNKAREFAF